MRYWSSVFVWFEVGIPQTIQRWEQLVGQAGENVARAMIAFRPTCAYPYVILRRLVGYIRSKQGYQQRIQRLTLTELRRLHPELRINDDFRRTSRGIA